MLDRYVTINQELCSANSITYIDTRQSFLSALPLSYYGYQGCLTVDGEHSNNLGAVILANLFSKFLLNGILQ